MQNQINPNPDVVAKAFPASHSFPNNNLPALIYKGVITENTSLMADIFEETFLINNWRNGWQNGIFGYHHYHSNTHEVLGISAGSATVQLGGPDGKAFNVTKGDMIVIPAGVAHKKLESSNDFRCVGAYPNGRSYDMNDGSEDPAEKKHNIGKTPLPESDPVYGTYGPLKEKWD